MCDKPESEVKSQKTVVLARNIMSSVPCTILILYVSSMDPQPQVTVKISLLSNLVPPHKVLNIEFRQYSLSRACILHPMLFTWECLKLLYLFLIKLQPKKSEHMTRTDW